MKIMSSLLAWLLRFSSPKVVNANQGPLPRNPEPRQSPPDIVEPIEVSTEEDLTIGINVTLGCQNTAAWGPNGELIRSRRNINVLCGCGHIAHQKNG